MKNSTILFIQGGGEGAFEEDKKLADNLQRALGDTVEFIYPRMPNESDPDYVSWSKVFDQQLGQIKGKVFLIGHSIGGFLLLKYLTETEIHSEVVGLFFIAIPFLGPGGWQYEKMELDAEFAARLSKVPLFFYHSTNDEIVPFGHLDLYAKQLPQATIRKIIGRGHQFNSNLVEVFEDIKTIQS